MALNVSVTPQRALGALCGLLAAACLYEIFAPLPELSIPETASRIHLPTLPLPSAFVAPAIATFAAINDRPIFSPDRKPIAPAAVGAAAAPPPPPMAALVGVILDSATRLALVRTSASPLAQAFAVGATIQGWQLSEIAPDKIVLKYGVASDEIKLQSNQAAKNDAGPRSPLATSPQSGAPDQSPPAPQAPIQNAVQQQNSSQPTQQ